VPIIHNQLDLVTCPYGNGSTLANVEAFCDRRLSHMCQSGAIGQLMLGAGAVSSAPVRRGICSELLPGSALSGADQGLERGWIVSRKEDRNQLVELQVAARGITDRHVLDSFRSMPRELFLPEELSEFAYLDTALPIAEDQTISQPYVVAAMAQALRIRPGERVLEVGTGSGYAAAILSRIAGEVFTIERLEPLCEIARDNLARARRATVREELLASRLERAIGVVYRPDTELQSHYFQARLPEQFDELV